MVHGEEDAKERRKRWSYDNGVSTLNPMKKDRVLIHFKYTHAQLEKWALV